MLKRMTLIVLVASMALLAGCFAKVEEIDGYVKGLYPTLTLVEKRINNNPEVNEISYFFCDNGRVIVVDTINTGFFWRFEVAKVTLLDSTKIHCEEN